MREYEQPPLSLLEPRRDETEQKNLIEKEGTIFIKVSSFRRSMVYVSGLALSAFNFWLCKDASTAFHIVSCTSGFLFFVSARYY